VASLAAMEAALTLLLWHTNAILAFRCEVRIAKRLLKQKAFTGRHFPPYEVRACSAGKQGVIPHSSGETCHHCMAFALRLAGGSRSGALNQTVFDGANGLWLVVSVSDTERDTAEYVHKVISFSDSMYACSSPQLVRHTRDAIIAQCGHTSPICARLHAGSGAGPEAGYGPLRLP
jgi:hypothetical protein